MRKLINLFMFLFLVDGGISLADEILKVLSGGSPLGGLRELVAYTVILLAFPVYICIGLDKRLPKLVLILQTLFVFWSFAVFWPLSAMPDDFNFHLIVNVLQVCLGMLPFFILIDHNGKRGLIRPGALPTYNFSITNLLLFVAGNIVIIPILVVLIACGSLTYYVQSETAGFMRLGTDGIYMEDRSYRRAGKTVRLTSMIHIGESSFYDELVDSATGVSTLILAEGLSDENELLKGSFSYNNLANLLNLASQEEMRFNGVLIDESELEGETEIDSPEPHILVADVDVSSFDPLTIEFLKVISRELLGSKSFSEGFSAYNAWVEENMTADSYSTFKFDVLTRRNEVVINVLKKSLDHYDSILIPWGALHMPGIEQGLLEQGFRLDQVTERRSVNFAEVDFAGLFGYLQGQGP